MKKILICVMIGLLSGCLGGRSQPSETYSLNMIPATEITDTVKTSVNVAGVQIPKYLDRPQIVVKEVQTAEVKVLEKHRWIEPLSDLISRVLADDLSESFPHAVIKQRTLASEKFDYSVSVDITQLDIEMGQKINMVGWWSLRKTDGQVTQREKIDLSVHLGEQYTDVAQKQSELIRKLADQIGLSLKKLKK